MGINGMNVKKRLNIIGTITTIIYLGLIVAFVMNMFSFDKLQKREEQDYIVKIVKEIERAVLNEDENETKSILTNLVSEYGVEITLDDENETIFKTIPHSVGEEHFNSLNSKAVLLDSSSTLDTPLGVRNLWYAIYNISNSEIMTGYYIRQGIIMVIALVVLAISIGYLGVFILEPLRKLRNSIQHAYDFNFDQIQPSRDALNIEFEEFAGKLENQIHAVSRQHTQLEKALQVEKERLNNTLTVSKSYIHDFKTPLHQVILENDFYIKNLESPSNETIQLAKINNDVIDGLIKNINEVLLLMNSDVHVRMKETELININDLIYETVNGLRFQVEKQGILIDIEMDEIEDIKVNKPAAILLIHNLISNITNHATKGSVANISILDNSDYVSLVFKNESSKENINGMKKSEQIFNAVLSPSTNEYVYSSGNGLFLIKDLAEIMGGTYEFVSNDNIVTIIVKLPKGKEDNYD